LGTKYDVRCETCGYRAVVSGGKDVGMITVVQTMTCDDCKDLVDVIIGRFGEKDPVEDYDLDVELGACPQCGGTKVVPWDVARPCPRCRSEMIPGATVVEMWD
jgi:hypothetical protein